jgi:hypothetical protein
MKKETWPGKNNNHQYKQSNYANPYRSFFHLCSNYPLIMPDPYQRLPTGSSAARCACNPNCSAVTGRYSITIAAAVRHPQPISPTRHALAARIPA